MLDAGTAPAFPQLGMLLPKVPLKGSVNEFVSWLARSGLRQG